MNLDILTTLMNVLGAKKDFSSEEKGEKGTQNTSKSPQNLINALSKFLSNFSSQNKENSIENTAEEKQATTPSTPNEEYLKPPLQSGMLDTMTSHDSFIKRVKEKNQKA